MIKVPELETRYADSHGDGAGTLLTKADLRNIGGGGGAETDGVTLTGDGTSAHPLAVDMSGLKVNWR
jgi:hypothetical protein